MRTVVVMQRHEEEEWKRMSRKLLYLKLINLALLIILELLHVTFELPDLLLCKFLLFLGVFECLLKIPDGRFSLFDLCCNLIALRSRTVNPG